VMTQQAGEGLACAVMCVLDISGDPEIACSYEPCV
jgi:hypothetical protein